MKNLYVENYTIDDDQSGESWGNQDGNIDAGETIELPITLRNSSTTSLTNVVASLSAYIKRTSDPSLILQSQMVQKILEIYLQIALKPAQMILDLQFQQIALKKKL